ncbi:TIGR04211 family SH3 domain-containing protein [Thalassotalea profundi]|uniref:SH3 domain protein n=1 Tax=Thalassotalea profundi TaxID=2036687 RepID=A0ABQ3IJY5_9GAMM|nr:TIGR04211 family SH3 domain-containing protein [Thalassotalea profundi]GHE84245.1 SH3 domain protein [Thalassotalea profundi]
MKIIKCLFASAFILFSPLLLAEETTDNLTSAYISDDLFIYMHAGPGNNYRILGSINAGEEVKLTGRTENDYTQILDSKNRETWVENRYINTTPGVRNEVKRLKAQLASNIENNDGLSSQLTQAHNEIERLNIETKNFELKVNQINQELENTKLKIKNQDTELKKEWFFNGAIVLVIGLLLGLIIPKISGRKKSSMDNWG